MNQVAQGIQDTCQQAESFESYERRRASILGLKLSDLRITNIKAVIHSIQGNPLSQSQHQAVNKLEEAIMWLQKGE